MLSPLLLDTFKIRLYVVKHIYNEKAESLWFIIFCHFVLILFLFILFHDYNPRANTFYSLAFRFQQEQTHWSQLQYKCRIDLFYIALLPNVVDAKPFLLGSLLMYNANAVIAQQDIIRHKCQIDSIDSICNVGFFFAFESINDEMFKIWLSQAAISNRNGSINSAI